MRSDGLSAMIRVKDEAEYLPYALRSIYPWVDEIIIAVQGEQSDQTWTIAQAWAELDKVATYHYPHDSYPNGPGHDQHPYDERARAYFYNWTMDKTTCRHVIKWDGDMVAFDETGRRIHEALGYNDFVRFDGVEIVSTEPYQVPASHPRTAAETRVFPADRCYYVTGPYCEVLTGPPPHEAQYTTREPMYLHFKYCKKNWTQAWPDNWREMPHFTRLMQRAKPGRKYKGPMPKCL